MSQSAHQAPTITPQVLKQRSVASTALTRIEAMSAATWRTLCVVLCTPAGVSAQQHSQDGSLI